MQAGTLPPMTPSAPTRLAGTAPVRSITIDALRFAAVVLVLGRHLTAPLEDPRAGMSTAVALWHRCGWLGVDLFFVLSGFLVAGLLFAELRRTGSVQLGRFLVRRGFKIYPAFAAMLVVSWWWFGAELPPIAFVHEALFVQNYLQPVVWNHTWSLAVEEHFYLLLAAGVALALRGRNSSRLRHVPTVVITLCGLVLALRASAWLRTPGAVLVLPTHLRLDALACGVGLAHVWHEHRPSVRAFVMSNRRALLLIAVALLLPSVLLPIETSGYTNVFGLSANYLAFAALLAVCLCSDAPPPRLLQLAARLGVHSYSIYLWHMPVLKAVRWWIEPRWGHQLAMLCYLLGSLLVGVLAAQLIERPFLLLRDRLVPSRLRGASIASDALAPTTHSGHDPVALPHATAGSPAPAPSHACSDAP